MSFSLEVAYSEPLLAEWHGCSAAGSLGEPRLLSPEAKNI
jgi:hypothetical protein